MQCVDHKVGTKSTDRLSRTRRRTITLSEHKNRQSIHISPESPARLGVELAIFTWPVLSYFDLERLFLHVFRVHSQFARYLAEQMRAHWYIDFYKQYPEHRDVSGPSLSYHLKHRRLMLCVRHSHNDSEFGPFRIYKSRFKYTCRCGERHHIWFS